jgi:hypothetical protein
LFLLLLLKSLEEKQPYAVACKLTLLLLLLHVKGRELVWKVDKADTSTTKCEMFLLLDVTAITHKC